MLKQFSKKIDYSLLGVNNQFPQHLVPVILVIFRFLFFQFKILVETSSLYYLLKSLMNRWHESDLTGPFKVHKNRARL